MKKFDTLVGLNVEVFVDSVTIEGVIQHVDQEKIILNSSGSYILVYKSKITMVILEPEKKVEVEPEPSRTTAYHVPIEASAPPRRAVDGLEPGEILGTEHVIKAHEEPDRLIISPEPELVKQEPEEGFAQNGIAEKNQYGSILPATLLEQQPKDPMEKFLVDGILSDDSDDFSLSANILRSEEYLLSRAERQKIMKGEEDGSGE